MTLSLSGYTVGSNQPLNRARILWLPITGAVTGTGVTPVLAANDFTNQRWFPGALPGVWTLETAADAQIDTVFIAAHNLGSTGATVTIATSAATTGGFTDRATITPTDNTAIAAMFNTGAGVPHTIRRLRVTIDGASAATQIGIIRAGVALQMEQAIYGGVSPIGLSRAVETRHSVSETGQWLGRTVQRQAAVGQMSWQHLSGEWYRANFAPFAAALPEKPFGLIQNPARMPESVAWCWTDNVPAPSNMGVLDLMEVSLNVTGLLE